MYATPSTITDNPSGTVVTVYATLKFAVSDFGESIANVPTAPPAPAPEPKPVSTLPASYEVQRGDHLWGIASQPRIYGNPYAWPLIYKANSAKIKDADVIHPGQNFDINRSASTGDIDAAVRHARTRGAWKLGVTEDSDKAYLAGKK